MVKVAVVVPAAPPRDAVEAAMRDAGRAAPEPPPTDVELLRISLTLADGTVVKGRVPPYLPTLTPASGDAKPAPGDAGSEPICVLVGTENMPVWVNPRYVMMASADPDVMRGSVIPPHLRRRIG